LIGAGAMDLSPALLKLGHEAFVDGKYLFHLSAMPWFAYEAEGLNPTLACRFLPLPLPTQGQVRVSQCGSARLGMARPLTGTSSGDHDACWEAFRAVATYEAMPELGRDLRSLPARVSCHAEAVAANPRLKGFVESLSDVQFAPTSWKANRRRDLADALLTSAFADRQMLEEPDRITNLLREMIRRTDSASAE
jgi:hypothetical protein